MGKLLKALKSKKGFSLAYAMVVCLFLALVTGSVTTIALLQQDQTGSDLNTRQAYISAKSGLESVKNHLNKSLKIEGAVLTMYDMRTNLSNQVVREVKRYFDDKVYKTVIPRNVKLSEAPSFGMPISLYDPKSKGARCYEKLAKEVMTNNK